MTELESNATKEDPMRTLLPRAGRRVLLASATVIALAVAGIAIADPGSPGSTKGIAATFAAGTQVRMHSETCTPTSGDAYTTTDTVFSGQAASSDPRLNGPITIHVRSVYDSTTNFGSLKGDVEIDSTANPSNHVHARLSGTLVGNLAQGWLDGNLGEGSHFMGSFSANFATNSGWGSGSIGATGPAPPAAIVWNGRCENPHPNPPPHGNSSQHDNGNDDDQGDHHNHGH
jgi:hypothetical protein